MNKMTTQTIGKAIRNIALAGLVALASGCTKEETIFQGQIDDKKIKLVSIPEDFNGNARGRLEVTTTNDTRYSFCFYDRGVNGVQFCDFGRYEKGIPKRYSFSEYNEAHSVAKQSFEYYFNKTLLKKQLEIAGKKVIPVKVDNSLSYKVKSDLQ